MNWQPVGNIAGKAGTPGMNGKSVAVDDVLPELKAHALRSVADVIAERGDSLAADAVAKHLQANPPKDGKDGTSVTADDVLPELKAMTEQHLASLPIPKDGESVTTEQIESLIEKRLAARTAEWQLDFEKRAQDTMQKCIDRMPKPKDGRDGFGLKDFSVTTNDCGRTLVLAFDDGERREEQVIVTAVPKYCEVWQKGTDYDPGDMVTWGGSVWACINKTTAQPNGYNPDWKLAVKRGKNGVSPDK